jgi:hypothetical protein
VSWRGLYLNREKTLFFRARDTVSNNPVLCKISATEIMRHIREIAGDKITEFLKISTLQIRKSLKVRFSAFCPLFAERKTVK